MAIQAEGKLEAECSINSIEAGTLKNLYIVKMNCGVYDVEFDIVDVINIFNKGDKVKLIISKQRPEYSNRDFCAHGYLFYEKKQENNKVLDQISLFGLIVKIYSDQGLIQLKIFNMMDHVYYCVKKLS
ncbi:MAG: DNA-directed RNA polymerase subunit G [Sulfolobus sp.]